MRNLKLDVVNIQKLPINSENVKRCIHVNDSTFVLNKNNVHYIKNDIDVIIKTNVSTIDWIPVENILYMGDGEKFECFNIQTEETSKIEIPEGYVIHEWNPSQDRIALIDSQGILKIVLLDAYNSHCTFIGEYQLEKIESSPFINIGWGSRDTQFKGSEGKQGKKTSDDGTEISEKDTSLCISWRDDGDIFAVSFTRNSHRIFKTFSCECEFLFESEFKAGICTELAWKPDGSLIATENQSPNGHSIMFFEKNGLHRFDLKLPSNISVRKIRWNPSGDIFMIWQQDSNGTEISLWTFSNYKWYLKQSLNFNKDNLVNYVGWHDKKWLEVITSNHLIRYNWKCVTHVSNSNDNEHTAVENLGAVVVIDGKTLLVTITSAQIKPPPYSTYNIEFDKPINNVVFGSKHNTLAVILTDYTLKIIELAKNSYTEKFTNKIDHGTIPLTLNHFVFNDEQSALFCVENQSIINKYEIDMTNNTLTSHKYDSFENVTDLLRVNEPSERGFHLGVCEGSQLMICHPDAESQMLSPDDDKILTDENGMDTGGHNSVEYAINQYNVFSLNSGRFYYNGKKVANNITSYLFCHGYLLLTTTENKLLCVKLSEKSLTNLELNNFSNVYTRTIPSGALLVSAVPGTRKVILQVPRGELEIINPRVLAINDIDRLLSKKKHLEAYMIMRTDRINPNLFYDINPTRFLTDIEDFIKNVNNCEYIDVFLTQLQDSNVTEELYSNCFEDNLPVQPVGSKVAIIADTFISSMKQIDVNYYLQSIITAYLCKGTNEDLEKALEELSSARGKEESGVKLRVAVDSTLEHMILLTSVEKLYDIALGMDKLEMIMWVASKSQLDPLEYIPFLQELIHMEDNYRNYKINCHIKRFEKAFKYIIKCDNILDEMQDFVTKNSLHNIILKYIQPDNQWYKPMLQLYAEYLNSHTRHKESGLIFMRIEEYKLALENFVKACCVKEALIAMNLLNCDLNQINDLLVDLASRLIEKKNYQDASYIFDSILKNYEEAISVLVKGNLWSDAFYLAIKNNRKDIIETDIKPAILTYADDLCAMFVTYDEEFTNIKTRLQTIRTEKITQLKQGNRIFDHDDHFENVPECAARNIDLESVVSTNYSRTSQRTRSTNMTSASSRRRKRIERKVLQIREGSSFENVAIIRRLYIILIEMQNLAQTVNDTCTQMFLFPEQYEKSIELQSSYEKILNFMNSSKDSIWPTEMLVPPNPLTPEAQVYRRNIEHLEMQHRFPPQETTKNWKSIFSS